MPDYTTEADLDVIAEWPYGDLRSLMLFVQSIWAYPEYFNEPAEGIWLVSTGGWSGNEDIIDAMQQNLMFWSLCWLSSRRGGHYMFQLPSLTPKQEPSHVV